MTYPSAWGLVASVIGRLDGIVNFVQMEGSKVCEGFSVFDRLSRIHYKTSCLTFFGTNTPWQCFGSQICYSAPIMQTRNETKTNELCEPSRTVADGRQSAKTMTLSWRTDRGARPNRIADEQGPGVAGKTAARPANGSAETTRLNPTAIRC